MRKWLVATLAAPFAAFGEDPGNVVKGSADTPTRSGLIGLAAGTMGVELDDYERLAEFASVLRVATRSISTGTPIVDLHTVHTLPSPAGMPATRAAALARKDDIVTSVTYRTYRSDYLGYAAWRTEDEDVVSLESLRDAFLRPRLAPFLGRRSCPLSEPMRPEIMEGEDVVAVFAQYHRRIRDVIDRREMDGAATVAVEDASDLPAGVSTRRRLRTDDPVGRIGRAFGTRIELSTRIEGEKRIPA